MGLSAVEIGGIVSAFVAGYGILHIPAGVIAERIGMRAGLTIGILVQAAGVAGTACAQDYTALLAARFLCGAGASILIGNAIGLISAWFRNYELGLANGLTGGVAFSTGAALGIYGGGALANVLNWRDALLLSAGCLGGVAILLLVALPQLPTVEVKSRPHHTHTLTSLRRVLFTRRLWLIGAAYCGGYGGYLTAVAMLPDYAVRTLSIPVAEAARMSAVMMIGAILGSALGGWLADTRWGPVRTFLIAVGLETLALALVPFGDANVTLVAASLIGIGGLMAFISWIAVPGFMQARLAATDIPTAAGLMLTIVAIGAAALPLIYGEIAMRFGSPFAWVGLAVLTIASACLVLFDRALKVGDCQ